MTRHTASPIPRLLCSLALLHFRHGSSQRALLYGMAAARLGHWTPTLVLVLAAVFLRLGYPDQAQAVLSRFEAPQTNLMQMPKDEEIRSARRLMARAALGLGDFAAARQHGSKVLLR